MTYRVAVVGTGATPDDPDRDGFAMAYRHATGYVRLEDCELVACADLVPANARAFAQRFDIPSEAVYEDHETMLADAEPDVVSVCVPPSAHAQIVVDCARSGVVEAIHCEKPLATSPAECRRAVAACRDADVQLTVNHQRRFAEPVQRAKQLLADGTVGDLRRLAVSEGTLFDAGCHNVDLCGYFTDEAAAEWVLAGLDYSEENVWFGEHNANQVIAQWRYENGVHALGATGEGADLVGCYLRAVGDDGVVEVGVDDGPSLRYRVDGGGWREVDTDENIHGPSSRGPIGAVADRVRSAVPGTRPADRPTLHEQGVADVIAALRHERTPVQDADHALAAMDVVFGAWESARRPGRVDLPVTFDDNPLEAMLANGRLEPAPAERDAEKSTAGD